MPYADASNPLYDGGSSSVLSAGGYSDGVGIDLRLFTNEGTAKKVNIKVKSSNLQNGLPIRGKSGATVDKVDDNDKALQRRIYGLDGRAIKDFDTSDHGLPSAHPTGAHKHEFNYDKKRPRGKPIPLTAEELEMNKDIIRRGENYRDEK